MEVEIFFIVPQDTNHSFNHWWTVLDMNSFNEGQTYFKVLEIDSMRLAELKPLAYRLDDLLDLAYVKDVEGIANNLQFSH